MQNNKVSKWVGSCQLSIKQDILLRGESNQEFILVQTCRLKLLGITSLAFQILCKISGYLLRKTQTVVRTSLVI